MKNVKYGMKDMVGSIANLSVRRPGKWFVIHYLFCYTGTNFHAGEELINPVELKGSRRRDEGESKSVMGVTG
jgi:hypothetical protein